MPLARRAMWEANRNPLDCITLYIHHPAEGSDEKLYLRAQSPDLKKVSRLKWLYTEKEELEASIRFFTDESLFSAAAANGLRLEKPDFMGGKEVPTDQLIEGFREGLARVCADIKEAEDACGPYEWALKKAKNTTSAAAAAKSKRKKAKTENDVESGGGNVAAQIALLSIKSGGVVEAVSGHGSDTNIMSDSGSAAAAAAAATFHETEAAAGGASASSSSSEDEDDDEDDGWSFQDDLVEYLRPMPDEFYKNRTKQKQLKEFNRRKEDIEMVIQMYTLLAELRARSGEQVNPDKDYPLKPRYERALAFVCQQIEEVERGSKPAARQTSQK